MNSLAMKKVEVVVLPLEPAMSLLVNQLVGQKKWSRKPMVIFTDYIFPNELPD